MKLSFATLVGLDPWPIEDVIAWASKHGFDALEVSTGPGYPAIGDNTYSGHLDLRSILADGPDATLDLFAAHGIEIAALSPMINLLTKDTV